MILKIIFLSIFIIFIICFTYYSKIEEFQYNREKTIFTYWEGQKNELVQHCFSRMKKINTDWNIKILTDKDFNFNIPILKSIENPCHRSDLIRLYYLEKYGGLWLDASIINLQPVTKWLSSIWKDNNIHQENDILIGYGYPGENSILENWLFYCTKNCSFLTFWKNEFIYALSIGFDNYYNKYKEWYEKEYPKKVLFLPHLTMHLCFCVVYKRKQYQTKIIIIPSCNGPYQYLCDHDSNNEEAVESLLKKNEYNLENVYFIKLRGTERDIIEKKSKKSFEKDSILYNLYFS